MKVSKFCTFEINLLGQIFSIVICVWFPCPYEDLNIKKTTNEQTSARAYFEMTLSNV